MFIKHKKQILEECAVLLEQIKKIGIPNPSELHNVEEENDSSKDVPDIIREDGTVLTPIKNSFKLNLFQRHRVNIKDEDKKAIIDLAKEYLNVDLSCDRDFFDFGNLEVQPELLGGTSYDGTQEEKDKHNKITELEYSLHRVQMMDWYVTIFDGMLFLPLAIENVSTVYDEDVDIHFSVKGNVDIIRPSKKLIKSEMQGLEGLIYEEDIDNRDTVFYLITKWCVAHLITNPFCECQTAFHNKPDFISAHNFNVVCVAFKKLLAVGCKHIGMEHKV